MSSKLISSRLCDLREKSGVSQDVVAEACNISRVALTRYENGQREPRMQIAARLADYYGVSVDYILGRDEKTEPIPEDELQHQNALTLTGLTPEEMQRVMDFVDGLKAGRK